MFGESWGGVVGLSGFIPGEEISKSLGVFLLFQLMFCSAVATIVSGAVSERMSYRGYMLMTVVVALPIYPIVGHWVWSGIETGQRGGWLAALGFHDFAGSTVVHSVGGWIGLAAVLVIGPRIGRFAPGSKGFDVSNPGLSTVGVILIWIGWIGFNGGSTLSFDERVPMIIVLTMLGGAAGALGGHARSFLTEERPESPRF